MDYYLEFTDNEYYDCLPLSSTLVGIYLAIKIINYMK